MMFSQPAGRFVSVLCLLLLAHSANSLFAAKMTYIEYDNDMAFPGWRVLFVADILDHGASAIDLRRESAGRLMEDHLDQDMLYWVNKNFSLPYPHEAADLMMIPPEQTARPEQTYYFRAAAMEALLDLLATGSVESGESLLVLSSYRSYATQVFTYNYWVSLLGVAQADRESARAGHSEHQLGTVVDLTTLTLGTNPWTAFGDSLGGIWIREQAHRFGFVISYHADKESVTGYIYEPWHIRYVGVALATWLHENEFSLEEAFQAVYGQGAQDQIQWGLPNERNPLCRDFAYYDQQLWTCNPAGNAIQRCAEDGSLQIRLCPSGCGSCPFGTQDQCSEKITLGEQQGCDGQALGKNICAKEEGTMRGCVGKSDVTWQCERRRCVSSGNSDVNDFFE